MKTIGWIVCAFLFGGFLVFQFPKYEKPLKKKFRIENKEVSLQKKEIETLIVRIENEQEEIKVILDTSYNK